MRRHVGSGVALAIIVLVLVSGAWAQLDPRYHTYEEMMAELDSLVDAYPSFIRVDSIGISTHDSMTIWAVKISDNVDVDEDEPEVLYHAVHHAEEVLGLEICLYMINDLLSRYASSSRVRWWVNHLEIWFVPLLNPEGHKVVTDGLDLTFRKNKRDNNENGVFDYSPGIGDDVDGVDLNRNYDFDWHRSDTTFRSDYYRGVAPFSELEAQAMRDFIQSHQFITAIFYHSARSGSKEVIYYPWCWGSKRPPDYPIIKELADTVAHRIEKDDGIGHYLPFCSSSHHSFARNWIYIRHGTLPMLIEVGEQIHPPGDEVDDICQRNLNGAYYLLDRVGMGASLTGLVTDAVSGGPLVAEVSILEARGGILSPRMTDPAFGRYRRILKPGSFTLQVSKKGYSAQTIPGIVVNPSNPTVRHIALDPLPQWTVSGLVTDSSGGAIYGRIIFRGEYADTVITDRSGGYVVSLSQGDYVVSVDSPEHVLVEESLSVFGDTTVDFTLPWATPILEEDFEGDLSRWVAAGPWALTASCSHSGARSATESPDGDYDNSADRWLALADGIDLSRYSTASLHFWHRYWLEPDFDSAWVEISTDSGETWSRLGGAYSGMDTVWADDYRSLDQFCGKVANIRFRLVSDGSEAEDGWCLDDVRVAGEMGEAFIRGDVQADGDHDLFDAIGLLTWLVEKSPSPPCAKTTDVDDDGDADIFDAIEILDWLGGVSSAPAEPCCGLPLDCGTDPTPDSLTCASYPPCHGKAVTDKTAFLGRLDENRLAIAKEVVVGRSTVVSVTLRNAEPLMGFSFRIDYDPEFVRATMVDNTGSVTEGFGYFASGVSVPGVVMVSALADLEMEDGVDLLPAGEHQVAKITFVGQGRELSHDVPLKVVSSLMAMNSQHALIHQRVDGLLEKDGTVPERFNLFQNHPNPFNPVTLVPFHIPAPEPGCRWQEAVRVSLKVFNISGQMVRTLVDDALLPGNHQAIWDGQDDRSREVTSGVYFCRLTAGDFEMTRRLVLLR